MPVTSGGSRKYVPSTGSAPTSSAAASSVARTASTSAQYATRTSTTARPHSWVLLPVRRISPLRTNHRVPLPSRTLVTRSATSSTVPVTSPKSTVSPTPYWSSSSMNVPDRKSFTRLCAPKPSATPAMPAEARNGAMFTPSSVRTRSTIVAPMRMLATDRSTEPTVRARWARRADASGFARSRTLPTPESATPWSRLLRSVGVPSAMCSVILRMTRRTSARAIAPTPMMRSTRSGTPTNHSNQSSGLLGSKPLRTSSGTSAGTRRTGARRGWDMSAGYPGQVGGPWARRTNALLAGPRSGRMQA